MKQDIIRSIAARLEMHADSLVEEYPSPSEGDFVTVLRSTSKFMNSFS